MPENKELIRLPVSCLAEFVSGRPRSPEAMLRPFKFKTRGEGFARSSYYRFFLTAVRDYHSGGNSAKVFQMARFELQNRRDQSSLRWEQVKLDKNIAAIDAYSRVYGNRKFKVLPNHRIDLRLGPLVLTAQPDLWVEEDGTQVLLKVGVSKKKRVYRDVLLTVMRKAAVSNGYRVRAKNVVYLDISTAKEYACQAGLIDFNVTFMDAARVIAKTWPLVRPVGVFASPAMHQNAQSPV